MAKTTKTGSKSTETKKKSAKSSKASKATRAAKPGEELQAAGDKKPRSNKPVVPRKPLTPRTIFAPWGLDAKWKLVDATGQPVGRLASHIASALMGKDKPTYTRHADTGDHVVVINAKDVVLTGNKWRDKTYYYHTNYPGGIKSFTAQEMKDKHPERVIERAVYGMLPKGHMGRKWYSKLRVFAGAEHPHTAQQPEVMKLGNLSTRQERA